jgi:AcrR family transcriptional regulator
MARKIDPADRILDSALSLAAEQGWRDLSLAAIAQRAKLSLAETYRTAPSKTAILALLERRVDAAVLSADGAGEDEAPRDRLFDVLMRRFDALAGHKQAIAAIVRSVRSDPLALLAATPQFLRSMDWMAEAAELPAAGRMAALRARLVGAIYLCALRVWLYDESPDMARTMAALDARLRWAERWTPLFGHRPRAKRGAAGEEGARA